MRITFACPTCGHNYTVGPALGGKRARCKHCRTEILVPPAPRDAPRKVAAPERAPAIPVPPDVDWFGLDEPASEPMPRRSYRDRPVDEEPELELPRRPGRKPTRTRRADREGQPWGMGVRNVAVSLMAICFSGTFFLNLLQWLAPQLIGLLAGLMAIALLVLWPIAIGTTLLSFVGAVFSFLRGNERALSGESLLMQVGWIFSIGVTLLVAAIAAFAFSVVTGIVTGRRASSSPPPASLATYENLVDSIVGGMDDYSDLLASAQPGGDLEGIADRMAVADRAIRAAQDRAERTPYPSRDQIRQLKARYLDTVRQSATRNRDASREAAARFRDNPKLAAILDEGAAESSRFLSLYELRSSFDWYQAVFGPKAGTRASAGSDPAEDLRRRLDRLPGPPPIVPSWRKDGGAPAARGPVVGGWPGGMPAPAPPEGPDPAEASPEAAPEPAGRPARPRALGPGGMPRPPGFGPGSPFAPPRPRLRGPDAP